MREMSSNANTQKEEHLESKGILFEHRIKYMRSLWLMKSKLSNIDEIDEITANLKEHHVDVVKYSNSFKSVKTSS